MNEQTGAGPERESRQWARAAIGSGAVNKYRLADEGRLEAMSEAECRSIENGGAP